MLINWKQQLSSFIKNIILNRKIHVEEARNLKKKTCRIMRIYPHKKGIGGLGNLKEEIYVWQVWKIE